MRSFIHKYQQFALKFRIVNKFVEIKGIVRKMHHINCIWMSIFILVIFSVNEYVKK